MKFFSTKFLFLILAMTVFAKSSFADSYDRVLKVAFDLLRPIEKYSTSRGGTARIRAAAEGLQEMFDIREAALTRSEKENRLSNLASRMEEDLKLFKKQPKMPHDDVDTRTLMDELDEIIKRKKNSDQGLHWKIRSLLTDVKNHTAMVQSVGGNITADELIIVGVGAGLSVGRMITPIGREFFVVVPQGTFSLGLGAQVMGGYYQFEVDSRKIADLEGGGGTLAGGIGDNHSGVSVGVLGGITVDKSGNNKVIEGGIAAGLYVGKGIGMLSVKLFPILPDHRHFTHFGQFKHLKKQLGFDNS